MKTYCILQIVSIVLRVLKSSLQYILPCCIVLSIHTCSAALDLISEASRLACLKTRLLFEYYEWIYVCFSAVYILSWCLFFGVTTKNDVSSSLHVILTEISRTLIIIHNNTQTHTYTHTSSIIQQNSLFFSAVFAAFCGSSICVQGFKSLFLSLALLSLNPCVQRLWEYQRIYTSA